MLKINSDILAAVGLILLLFYLNNKEEWNNFFSRFFSQLFAISIRRITKKADKKTER